MFGTLLESRARRHRRTGGAALSVAAHIAIIGVATAATIQGKPAPPTPPEAKFLVFKVTPAPTPAAPRRTTAPPTSSPSYASAPAPIDVTIAAPTFTPPSLPSIDMSSVPTTDIVTNRSAATGSSSGPPGGTSLTSDATPGTWDSRELMMHIVSSAKPRYPETLRQGGIGGRVLVQFSVDTTGRVDMASVRVLQSTHDLFTQAVRSALGAFRFRPAEVNGKRTAALAEMPFEFQVR